MSRIKIELPELFQFSTHYEVRVTDLNYGNHLGNDKLLGLLHQARIDFIHHLGGASELDFLGTSLIMADVGISYKNEGFLNDNLKFELCLANPTRVAFDIYYKVTLGDKLIATAKTGMVCYNYQAKKVMPLPEALLAVFPKI